MKKTGIIYRYENRTRSKYVTSRAGKAVLTRLFQSFIAGGVLGLIVLFSPLLYTEAQYRFIQARQEEQLAETVEALPIAEPETIKTPGFKKLLNDKYIAQVDPVNNEFAIVIPKIGVNSSVQAHVDPANRREYLPALEQGAAHALGTAMPGDGGTSFIFAHSTDYIWNIQNYNAIFYLIKDLEPGDQIYIVRSGVLIPYQVTGKEIVNAYDTTHLEPNFTDNKLILQTCWPPGTTLKRMLVFAEPVGSLVGLGDTMTYSIDN